MARAAEKYAAGRYHLRFEWSDARIYCSQRVWKVYPVAPGLEIGERRKMRERYGERYRSTSR